VGKRSTLTDPGGEAAIPRSTIESRGVRIESLARLALDASGAAAILISWRDARGAGSAHAPDGPRWQGALWAILGLLLRASADGRREASLRMSAPEVELRCGRAIPTEDRLEATGAFCAASASGGVSVIALTPQGIPAARSAANVEMIVRQALADLALEDTVSSVEFWRTREGQVASRLASEKERADLARRELARMAALVRTLGERMFRAVDSERARIARDLHDDHAQMLAAAKLALDADRTAARPILKRLETELRARIRDLKPAALGNRGLAEALRTELQRLKDAGLKTRLTGTAVARNLPPAVQQACYQVAREAISNIMRHARAARAEVRLEHCGTLVRLIVSDDGTSPKSAPSGGIGLNGLAERLELIGGTLRFDSRPGATRLIAEIPVPRR